TATAQSWTPTPEPTPTATLTVEESAAITQTATPEPPTPTLGPTATPNLLTSESFNEQYKKYLEAMRKETGVTEARYREVVRADLLRSKLSDYFANQVPAEEEQVHIRQVLLPTEEAARQARQALDGGKSFDEVAKETAVEKAGDLGFFGKGQMVPEFEQVVFTLEPGQISDPVKSQFGWHIIQVLERKGEGDQMQVHARHILVDTEEEARQIKQELEKGADFGQLALERSKDPSVQPPKTDLGWVTRDSTAADPSVIEAAFKLQSGAISDPIQVPSGEWAIVQLVEGPSVRALDQADLQRKRSQALQTWLNEAKAGQGVERLWDTSRVPPDPFLASGG
ncbi:MAG TPA: hypothetical protein DEP84_23315, partial [Chloroflexi bacterium]|nr:hypothetical protein [Chloroflexota bacterium]